MTEVGPKKRRVAATARWAQVRRPAAARSATAVAAERIGRLDRRGAPGALESYRHAVEVWEAVRRAVVARAPALQVLTRGGGVAALQGQVDLVLVAFLGAHLTECAWCWEVWTDGYRPGALLTAAVRRRPAGQILRAVETEQRARARGRKRRSGR